MKRNCKVSNKTFPSLNTCSKQIEEKEKNLGNEIEKQKDRMKMK